MRLIYLFAIALLTLTSCAKKQPDENTIISMQLIDRNGFSETISTKDRIAKYTNTEFLDPQPFQKVLRVFGKNVEGKSSSKITTYHPNGHIWQYLDVVDGRAHGTYKEWHINGALKMELNVIEGFADLQEEAQRTWVFDGKNSIWDQDGHLIAEISYDKGMLHEPSLYYYPSGKLKKIIPYFRDQVEGEVALYDEEGILLESIPFKEGMRDGKALGYWPDQSLRYEELYEKDHLLTANYFSIEGKNISSIKEGDGFQAVFTKQKISSLVEYQKGEAKGLVELFDEKGRKVGYFHQVNGKKCGEEWAFYVDDTQAVKPHPKLCVNWDEDLLQGEVRTWYENGILESQRQFNQNKKHGVALAWYKNGDVMLMEEYELDKIHKASYFKKGDKKPVSKIENGKGTATMYSAEGAFIKKIAYEKGLPHIDPPSS